MSNLKKVFIGVASYKGLLDSEGKPVCRQFVESLDKSIKLLRSTPGYECAFTSEQGDAYVQHARNSIVHRFRTSTELFSEPDSPDDKLVFLDDDLQWNPPDLLRLLETPGDVVAGVYRRKRDEEDYPVVINCGQSGVPLGRPDGCIDAALVPAGFLSIKRHVIDKLCECNPQLKYEVWADGQVVGENYYDLFPQGVTDGRWWGEDYAFCRLWTAQGGKIWVLPDVWMHHSGRSMYGREKWYTGNYHEYLLHRPGGLKGTVNIESARNIFGYMPEEQLIWLANEARKHEAIVEVGSFMGRSTRALADNTPGKVWAVDDWYGPRDSEHQPEERAIVFQKFSENLKDHIDCGKVIPITANHQSDDYLDVKADMVFIDGDHSYEAVKHDILYWKDRIKPGGLLSGHDGNLESVQKALFELIPQARLTADQIWYAKQGA